MKHSKQLKTLTIITFVLFVCAVFMPMTAFAKDKIIIGWSNAGMGDSWREFLVANFKSEVAKHPEISKYYITNADEKVDKQIADIESLLVKNIDVLIIIQRWVMRLFRLSSEPLQKAFPWSSLAGRSIQTK